MSLLKLVLENCVFTFQDRFYKQLHGAAMGSPCSPVVANIYMEYFENMALGPELPVPIKDWKRYVDDVFSIIPQGKLWQFVKISKFHWSTYKIYHWTTKMLREESPFLDTFPKPQGGGIAVAVYRKPNHTDRYLDFNSSHPVSAKRAVVRALMDRAENVCSGPWNSSQGDRSPQQSAPLQQLSTVDDQPMRENGKTRSSNPSRNRQWDTETFLHLCALFPRIKWILQEDLQVHTSTSMLQRSQHPEIP